MFPWSDEADRRFVEVIQKRQQRLLNTIEEKAF